MTEPDPRADRIIAAGKARFASDGFEKTRLSDVARDAGVAVGTIYLRHPGKTELLVAVLSSVEQGFVAAMEDPACWAVPWPARFDVVFGSIFAVAAREPTLHRLMALSPFAFSAGWRPGDGVRRAIAEHLRDGQSQGLFRPDIDPQIAAAIAHGMVEGAMAELGADPGRDPGPVVAHLAQAARAWLMK